MPNSDDVDLERSGEELSHRVEQFKRDGLTTSLTVQLLADLSVLSARLTTAAAQRNDLARKIDQILEKQSQTALVLDRIERLEKDHDEAVKKMDRNRQLIDANTEFRMKFIGGSIVGKMIWALLGAGIAIALNKLWVR